MLDPYLVPRIRRLLHTPAVWLDRQRVTADQVSVAGFVLGVISVILIASGAYFAALLALSLSRLADGIDGELARLHSPTDAGAYLDITLDFIFYALFPLGFAIANPADNALPAAVLIASFVGTGASFLAFASMAERHSIDHPNFAYKGLYYLNGLAEGTETLACFALMCFLPQHFALLAWMFAALCVLTAFNRVVFGYLTLKRY